MIIKVLGLWDASFPLEVLSFFWKYYPSSALSSILALLFLFLFYYYSQGSAHAKGYIDSLVTEVFLGIAVFCLCLLIMEKTDSSTKIFNYLEGLFSFFRRPQIPFTPNSPCILLSLAENRGLVFMLHIVLTNSFFLSSSLYCN